MFDTLFNSEISTREKKLVPSVASSSLRVEKLIYANGRNKCDGGAGAGQWRQGAAEKFARNS
jgi:hypothetical protein